MLPNGWPDHPNYSGRWCHSDMKDVAYFYNFKFYDKAVEKGNLKRSMEDLISIRDRVGDLTAWMNVNALVGCINACAIEKGVRYVYFKKSRNGWFIKMKSVPKEEWL